MAGVTVMEKGTSNGTHTAENGTFTLTTQKLPNWYTFANYRGVFADIPFDEIHGAFRHYYPRMTSLQEKLPLGGSLGQSSRRRCGPCCAGCPATPL